MSNEQTIEVETLEIADLEYDVGGMGSVEPCDGRLTMEGVVVVMICPPK